MTSTIILKQNNTSGSAPSAGSLVAGEVAVNTADGVLYTKHTDGTVKTVAPVNISNLPIIRPSLLLDFANSKTIDPRITFTRASTATYTGADGLIKNAASNEARFDHNPITGESLGLLIEEQRTNLLTYSENFDNAIWTKGNSTIIPNTAIAPDGTLTADKHVETTGYGAHSSVYEFSAVSGNTYTASYYVKSGERTEILIGFDPSLGFSTYQYGRFNLVTGVATTFLGSPILSIMAVGNGWYRCSITATATGTGNNALVSTQIHTGATNVYAGDGTSGIYIWGAQLEQGAFATSYIPSADSFTSRASTGTFIGSNGLIQSAATNVARYNYNPLNLALSPKLLLESASTNLLTYSEQFDNVVWDKGHVTITANATTAPDGTTTADKLVENTYNAEHLCYFSRAASNETVTFSVFAKAAERTSIVISLSNFSTEAVRCTFDLISGTKGGIVGENVDYTKTFANITSVGNGWYRCSLTTTKAAVNNVSNAVIGPVSSGTSLYTGNGTSGIYIWGAQLETGNTATSYIPTTSAQVTRSADVSSSSAATRPADNAVITGTNFSSWYRQDEGTVLTKADVGNSTDATFPIIADITDSPSNKISIALATTGKLLFGYVRLSNVEQAALYGTTYTLNTPFVYSMAYKTNDVAGSKNGSSIVSDSSANLPVTNKLTIGGDVGSTSYINGHIAKIAYYPKRLSNAELQSITTQ
jgi:hypothetical protein